jgi:hypothetical protein
MPYDTLSEIAGRSSYGFVDKLVAKHELSWRVAIRQRPHGAHGYDLLHSKGLQGPDVGSGGDL